MEKTHATRVLEHQQRVALRAAIRDMSDIAIHRLLEAGPLIGDTLRAELTVERGRRETR